MTYDVYLYDSADGLVMINDSDTLGQGYEKAEAIKRAQDAVKGGECARAVVAHGEDVHDIYDTIEDGLEAVPYFGVDLPAVTAPGLRSRPSALSERLTLV